MKNWKNLIYILLDVLEDLKYLLGQVEEGIKDNNIKIFKINYNSIHY